VSASFDHVGPMCRTVGDAALMFRAMTDHRIANDCEPDALPSIGGLRIGVVRLVGDICDAPVDPEVAAAFAAAVDVIRPLVAEVGEAELPVPDLARLIDVDAYAFHREHLAASPELYDPRTRWDAELGRKMSASAIADLRRALGKHRGSIRKAFAHADLVVLPTLPGLPMPIREAIDPFGLAACTFAFSIGGLPSISVPCGFSKSGLPIGLLIGGPALSEPRVLALARAYERATAWHLRRPSLWDDASLSL
jgi:aspartyl-tRNA(Asn)/glutamyl-tRNA(Gln) amidotransferase subunit A